MRIENSNLEFQIQRQIARIEYISQPIIHTDTLYPLS